MAPNRTSGTSNVISRCVENHWRRARIRLVPLDESTNPDGFTEGLDLVLAAGVAVVIAGWPAEVEAGLTAGFETDLSGVAVLGAEALFALLLG